MEQFGRGTSCNKLLFRCLTIGATNLSFIYATSEKENKFVLSCKFDVHCGVMKQLWSALSRLKFLVNIQAPASVTKCSFSQQKIFNSSSYLHTNFSVRSKKNILISYNQGCSLDLERLGLEAV